MIFADVQTDGAPPAFFWFFFLFTMVLVIGGLVLWIWALVDCIRVPDDRYYRSGNKLVWVLVIALAQAIGAIVYLIVGRPERSVREGWGTGASSGAPPPVAPPLPPGAPSMPPPPTD